MASITAAPSRADTSHHGTLLLVSAGVLLGTIGFFLERAQAHPLTAVWFRCAFGLLALSAWVVAMRRGGELRLAPRARAAALCAGSLMVLSWGLFFAAIERSSIAVATVVVHVQPFWVMALGALLLGERVAPRQWGAATLALLGLVLACGLASHDGAAQGRDAAGGLLLALGSSLLYAGVTLIARGARSVSALAMSWWQCAAGTVGLAWWPLLQGWPAAGASWAWLATIGVVHTGLAYVLWYGGIARLGAARGAVLQFVYPATAVLVDAVVFGRWLDAVQWAGVALMALGLWSANRVDKGRPAAR